MYSEQGGLTGSYRLRRKQRSIQQAAKITATTGATTQRIPGSGTLVRTEIVSVPPGKSVAGRLGGSQAWASVIVRKIGSENGLEVYKCCRRKTNFKLCFIIHTHSLRSQGIVGIGTHISYPLLTFWGVSTTALKKIRYRPFFSKCLLS